MKMKPKSSFLKRFSANTQGNIAVIGAFVIIPMIALIGGAIDFKRAFNAKADLRACMEATALMLPARGIGANSTTSQIKAEIDEVMSKQPKCASYTDPNTVGVHAVFSGRIITAEGRRKGNLSLSAEATIDTLILGALKATGMWGSTVPQDFKRITISTASNPLNIDVASNTRVEMALVLDTTGSMRSYGKLQAMKTAVSTLVDKLKVGDPDCSVAGGSDYCKNIRIGMVPFSYRINIGTPAQCNGLFKDAGCTTQSKARVPGWLNTTGLRSWGYDWNDSRCQGSDANRCTYNHWRYGKRIRGWWSCRTFRNRCNQTRGYHTDMSRWKGCVLARHGNKYTDNSRVFSSTATKIKAENSSCSSVKPVHRITNKLDDIKTATNNLNASGNTNTAIGLEWGWRLISKGITQGIDFDETGSGNNAEVKPYGDKEWKKVIILMTDGSNTTGQQNGNVSSRNRKGWHSNNATDTICANIKNEGVKIFAIAFRAPTSAQNLMKRCASKHSFYFNASSNLGLQTAFSTIAKEVSDLRVAY